MTKSRQIEVEFRAQLSETEHARIKKHLEEQGKLLSEQDQASYYFYDSGKAFKMVHDKDKGSMRIAHKLKTILQGIDFEELEIVIDPKDIDTAVPMFKSLLGINRVIYDEQKRFNYEYKGLEIALKWSEGWGHHIELEKVVSEQADVAKAEEEIRSVAKELGVELMTIADIKKLEDKILDKLERGDYKVAGYI
ncbi:CYTH domain-containing protein [Candidatus Saccharibacteria bacterium]|nr:CYTH domain-containing protein [Candidatus Saccharibacteria bacterium]